MKIVTQKDYSRTLSHYPGPRVLMLRTRPHPACLDGEDDGELIEKARQTYDPIRLVRMVKEITGYRGSPRNLIHHPGKLDGALAGIFHVILLAHHLIHHPHEADGVRKAHGKKPRSAPSNRAPSLLRRRSALFVHTAFYELARSVA